MSFPEIISIALIPILFVGAYFLYPLIPPKMIKYETGTWGAKLERRYLKAVLIAIISMTSLLLSVLLIAKDNSILQPVKSINFLTGINIVLSAVSLLVFIIASWVARSPSCPHCGKWVNRFMSRRPWRINAVCPECGVSFHENATTFVKE